MLFITETISNKEIESINNFFNEFESVETVSVEEAQKETTVTRYINSLVTSCYQKSVDEIANTPTINSFFKRDFPRTPQVIRSIKIEE